MGVSVACVLRSGSADLQAGERSVSDHDLSNLRRSLTVDGRRYGYFSLPAAEAGLGDLSRLPFSLKVLLENLLRRQDGRTVTPDDARAVAAWLESGRSTHEISFLPARVLMQDFTGVPAVVDLAAMREAMQAMSAIRRRSTRCPGSIS